MITIQPITRALVPVNTDAAERISAPNYDEFQGDLEIWRAIHEAPESVLRVTMAHCDTDDPSQVIEGDSVQALDWASRNMGVLRETALTCEMERLLFVYEIMDPSRPGAKQIGLGGMARTEEIRTVANPNGPIIRNEGIREPKARGRAKLVEATRAIIGTVNLAIEDQSGVFVAALDRQVDGIPPHYEVAGNGRTIHRIWLITEPGAILRFQQLLADEPEAYVADGNHRSAAAAMLGHENFLTVFFAADQMGIAPYNRLLRLTERRRSKPLTQVLETTFKWAPAPSDGPFQPLTTHEIGLYTKLDGWLRLIPRSEIFDSANASASIDHAIVQQHLFTPLGVDDPGDERLTFVGANKDAAWLEREVDGGRADIAVTLPPVTMRQFINVCRQRRMMPPKSTWFEPKIRSGLVMVLLGDNS